MKANRVKSSQRSQWQLEATSKVRPPRCQARQAGVSSLAALALSTRVSTEMTHPRLPPVAHSSLPAAFTTPASQNSKLPSLRAPQGPSAVRRKSRAKERASEASLGYGNETRMTLLNRNVDTPNNQTSIPGGRYVNTCMTFFPRDSANGSNL
ncbi:hypothetical protein PG997_013674 [Apiospora hydei]|uniref:Uncharacterized protein n=1 Tax=Apiospora hydei TaxID=1337664 RepID=A0ABR1V6W1_9PEZI